jgi:p-hydroxybenzoate 3-monooxygenase
MDSPGQTGYEITVERLEAEVCVVGAGPAGLVVAQRLLEANVSCVVVERLAAELLCARAKAGMIEHRTVRALERVGLAAPILEHGGTNGVVEFRVGGESRVFDYGALTGGRGHFVYPQHLLVRAWCERFLARGGHVRFATEVMGFEYADERRERATVFGRDAEGRPLALACEAVVLAGGAGSTLLPPGIVSHEHAYPFRWLTSMMEMEPLSPRTVYAPHERGFAAQLRRSASETRFYLQIPAEDGLDAWPDERIVSELEQRLGVTGLIRGPIVERDRLDLRVRVREPLQQGSVYLAGDAAHLITPAGGKGMNLAIQDALELAEGLLERLRGGSGQRLAAYSDVRLPAIWRTQEFSSWLLSVHSGGVLSLHQGSPDPGAGFARRLHRAQIERLFSDPAFARWFAHNYAGVDQDPATPGT